MTATLRDFTIIGGGIVGLAVGLELQRRGMGKVLVLEKEPRVGSHQSGRNSGVLHSGLYYKPGSLKARLCRAGKALMEEFCEAEGVPWERCGKVVVAANSMEAERLTALKDRGAANGVLMVPLDAQQLREIEPAVRGVAGLHVPETGITDYGCVCLRLAERIRADGGEVLAEQKLLAVKSVPGGLELHTPHCRVQTKWLVNCAGLHSDRIHGLCGGRSTVQIVPFRGEYYDLRPERQTLVRNLIYPVPDPALPFLGVHFTRMVAGGVECGPNAVLALAREGYGWTKVNGRDLARTLRYRGFRKLALQHMRSGMGEVWRSLNKRAFVRALQALIPEIRAQDLVPGRAGVRAQAVNREGHLMDDFVIETTPHAIHILNAPSPAATASLAIAREIVTLLAAEQPSA